MSGNGTATLLVTCPDQKGIVAAISNFLFQHRANIIDSDQHQDPETGLFLMRVEWELADFTLSFEDFKVQFEILARGFQMRWEVALSETKRNVALLASRHLHCLADLLGQYQAGDLSCNISVVIGNHPEARTLAELHGVPFFHVSTEGFRRGLPSEEEILEILRRFRVNLVILARYMQILSQSFIERFRNQIINIHHSFLPAFVGGKPYHQAFARGVKLIGATSHYVTEDLDNGPIIAQDVIPVSHKDSIGKLIQKGKDLEKVVLSRAIRLHLENRILVYGNKTVIFN